MKVSRSTYLSMWLNSFLPGAKPYEMLSSHAYRAQNETAVMFLDTIFGEGHCKECYQWERDNFDGIQD